VTEPGSLPMIVVEGEELAEEAVQDLREVGWTVEPGWRTTNVHPGLVLAGIVGGPDDARDAVLAAVAGVGLVVDARAPREDVDQLCDDLRRLGRLEHRVAGKGPWTLDHEQRRLLDLLASGRSLGSAATELHLSRRSADRRLAAARQALGAATTAAAISARRDRLARLPRPR
jgi:hypothetical protein